MKPPPPGKKILAPGIIRMPSLAPLSILLLCGLVWTPALHAQVLRSAENDPNSPFYRDVKPQPTSELNATVKRMRELVRELQNSDMKPAQKQTALDELLRDHAYILRQHATWLDWQKPQTVDSAALLLERMIFEIAADAAPTRQSREQVLRNAPERLELDPDQSQNAARYEPPLLAPITPQGERIVKAAPSELPAPTTEETATTVAAAAPERDKDTGTGAVTNIDLGKDVKVAVLADDQTTTAMHDDNTVLREVRNKKGQLVLFNTLHLWVGGALQHDSYQGDGLFTLREEGDSDTGSYVRRAEGILRASLLRYGELQVQYDFDAKIFRNAYWRWLSSSYDESITIGNQKEPMGLDWMVGNKFTTALEPSAPSSAFSSFRSKGIRYNRSKALESDENPFKIWGDSRSYVTSSIGLFGKDIENSNDTDWAVTGRVAIGGNKTENNGYHLGLSASYRHGEYDRIAPRPGLHDVNRILLARPDADTALLAGVEGMFVIGSLHGQGEFYYGDYGGGEVNAQGWGTYGQIGWLFGGKRRSYRSNWGLWAPVDASHEGVFEVFGRFSLSHGDDDENSSNELALLTLGGNWYYRQFRVSANLIFAETERDLLEQDDGDAFALRLQYIF